MAKVNKREIVKREFDCTFNENEVEAILHFLMQNPDVMGYVDRSEYLQPTSLAASIADVFDSLAIFMPNVVERGI